MIKIPTCTFVFVMICLFKTNYVKLKHIEYCILQSINPLNISLTSCAFNEEKISLHTPYFLLKKSDKSFCLHNSGKEFNQNIYEKGLLSTFRNFQHLELKLGKPKLDLLFLLSCKKRSVIPKFLWFKVINRKLKRSSAYYQCQKKLLDEEISHKRSRIRVLTTQVSSTYSDLSSLVQTTDIIHLKSLSDKENTRIIEKYQKIQEKKLLCLCSDSPSSSYANPEVIFNYSSCIITPDKKSILAKGLNFSLPQNRLDYCDFLVPFKLLHRQLK